VEALLFLLQAAARLPGGGISELGVNSALALIEGAAPKDEIEGALAVQMAYTPELWAIVGTNAQGFRAG
jgi:hypothetical protein